MEKEPTPTVLFEDPSFVVLAKPAGLVVHADGRTKERTLSEWVAEQYPECQEIGIPHALDNGRTIPRVGIVHRIDRDTSGLIVVARTPEAFASLQGQFLSRDVSKIYCAFVSGVWSGALEGVIDLPIGRSRKDFRQYTVPPEARGTLREARTGFSVIHTDEGTSTSCLFFLPKTGRTHQIRVHARACGHPIVGDQRYGGENTLGFTRLALHAASLSFDHPVSGDRETFVAPWPEDFLRAFAILGCAVPSLPL